MSKKISALTAFALAAAASGYMPDDFYDGPTKPPKKEPDADDLERIAKAEAKRARKAKRKW